MTMRFLLLAPAILLSVIGAPAQAQNYPWCAILVSPGGSQNCAFDSFDECQKSVAGMGGWCQKNNFYVAPAAPAPAAAPGASRGTQSPYH
jgi:hypothetical protein